MALARRIPKAGNDNPLQLPIWSTAFFCNRSKAAITVAATPLLRSHFRDTRYRLFHEQHAILRGAKGATISNPLFIGDSIGYQKTAYSSTSSSDYLSNEKRKIEEKADATSPLVDDVTNDETSKNQKMPIHTESSMPTSTASNVKDEQSNVKSDAPTTELNDVKAEKDNVDATNVSSTNASNIEANQTPTTSETTEASSARGDDTKNEQNGEPQKEKTSKLKMFFYACLGAAGSYFAYYVYLCDYNVSKAEWMLSRDISRWFTSSEEEGAARLSKFRTALCDELMKEVGLYFIYLDIDKDNGVRRSDAIDLIEQLEFSRESEACRNFISKGAGRGLDEKKFSGCGLQELAELIEQLILDEELSKLPQPEPSRFVLFGFDFQTLQREVTKRNNLLKLVGKRIQRGGSEVETRTVEKLKEINSKIIPKDDVLTSNGFQRPLASFNSIQTNYVEEDEVNDEEMKRLELQRLEKIASTLSAFHKRRGLTEAEEARLLEVNELTRKLKSELFEMEAEAWLLDKQNREEEDIK